MRVLIVEGSSAAAAFTAQLLDGAGMVTECATDALTALARRCVFRPDVVLLDEDVPQVADLSLVAHFSADACCGVIVLTARPDEHTRVAGLEAGADDMILKPALRRELIARIRAVHRRLRRTDMSAACRAMATSVATLTVDHGQRCLAGRGDARVPLTEAELLALECLLDADGGNVTRSWLSQSALRRPLHDDDRSVDQLVLKLRRKIVELGGTERAIQSVRRQGYVIPEPGLFRTVGSTRATRADAPSRMQHESPPIWSGE